MNPITTTKPTFNTGNAINSFAPSKPLVNIPQTTQFPSPITAPTPKNYGGTVGFTKVPTTQAMTSPTPKPMATVPSSSGASYQGVPITGTDQTSIQAQMAQIDQGLLGSSGVPSPSKYTPQNFNVPVSNTYDSTMLGKGSNLNTLQNTYNTKYQDMMTGKNPSLTGSDALMANIFNSKQYSPEEIKNLQSLSDINSSITAATLSERRQIKQLQEDGRLTKEQAQAFVSESSRRADARLADLAAAQTGVSNTLGVQAAIRQNQLGAYQTLFDMTKGTQTLSPGQSLYSATGQQVAGASGIAPQVTSTALQLYSQAASTGTTIVDENGNPDMNYYMQQASQLTGIPLPQTSSASQGYNGYGQQGGSSMAPSMGGAYGEQGYGNIEMIAPAFRSYVQPLSLGNQNVSYIDLTRVPTGVQNTLKAQAQAAGIPTLDEGGVNALASANTILNVIESAKLLSQKELSGGTWGRLSGIVKTKINDWFQTNPELASFNNLRETAAKTVTALGGGVGSGLRMNLPMIDVAVNNMPTSTDNYETAVKKADNVQKLILEGLSTKFPQFKQNDIFGTGNTPTQTSGGGGLYDF